MKYFLVLLMGLNPSAEGATWKKLNNALISVTPESTTCPSGYIGVPAMYPYTTRFFCVMKYEAVETSFSQPTPFILNETPWVSISRNNSRSKCKSLGAKYDLISNDQWQTIARNIAQVGWNWSTGVVGSGEINRGHSDSSPSGGQATNSNDAVACHGTGQSCSDTSWHAQRRTHRLSNGEVIWDFAGNVSEWVTNNSTEGSLGVDTYISQLAANTFRQIKYGADPATLCSTPGVTPYCGMGLAASGTATGEGAVIRGGAYNDGVSSGIYFFQLSYNNISQNAAKIGFRCIYVP